MPRQHPSILESLPSERLRIGEYAIDASTREVRGGEAPAQRVSLKAMDVLLLLARNPGKVVGRQAILDAIWPDTLPTDEVVTQAIAQLRRAFDDGKPARYIETIAKHGYRLLAPVEWEVAPQAQPHAGEPFGARVRLAHGGRMAVFVAGVIAAASAAGWWWSRPKSAPAAAAVAAADPSFVRLTSLPGGEQWPSLSPDGALVAYSRDQSSGASLMLQTTSPVAPRALTDGKDGRHDLFPVWSRDGREIAFVRSTSDGRCRFLVVPASGGTPRDIAACTQPGRFAWSPDGGSFLVGGPGPGAASRALRSIDLRDGREHPFPYQHPADAQDLAPAYSPDGKWIAFQRGVSRADLWRVPATGGTPLRVTRLETNFYGFAWTPDGKALVAARYAGHGLRLSRIDIDGGAVADLGIEDATFPSIALLAPAMAFVANSGITGIYRRRVADASNATASASPRMFASTGTEMLPSVSPDGKRIAFYSDRSGSTRLWWAELGEAAVPQLVDGIDPVLRQKPVWSGDGKRVLVVDADPKGDRLLEVDLASGRGTALEGIAGTPLRAAWLPGDAGIVVTADAGGGDMVATRYDRDGDRWVARGRLEHVDGIYPAPDGRHLLFTRDNAWGLWQANLDLSAPRLLDDFRVRPDSTDLLVPASGFFIQPRRLVVWDGGIALLAAGKDCALAWVPIPRSGNALPAHAPCLERRPGEVLGASYDARNDTLYYAYSSDENSDIGWMRLPAPAANPRR